MNKISKLIPNILSYSRIILTLIIDVFLYKKSIKLAVFCIFLASISDFFDGFLARKLNTTSKYGANLDLIADKIFSINMLLYIFFTNKYFPIFFIVFLLISREIAMVIIRNIYKKDIPASKLGKIKTVFLNISYVFLLINYEIFIIFFILGFLTSTFSQFKYLKT
ncbi:CDP-alcohol phosphatidyltransferase family protein [Alphaproteobacteria bacterium endosymbiont of Tiliacea citrago]|uniref:CDP-alcohol phosphatidyltransferase family protein n=1 Tax=Alphaproteobacteria bacterium endosymbiont of Tiliacea citrago TaxID=3077944 RepID=UPI00313B785A